MFACGVAVVLEGLLEWDEGRSGRVEWREQPRSLGERVSLSRYLYIKRWMCVSRGSMTTAASIQCAPTLNCSDAKQVWILCMANGERTFIGGFAGNWRLAFDDE